MKLRKIWKLLTSKFLLVCFLLLIELAILPTVIFLLSNYLPHAAPVISLLVIIVDVILVLCIINSEMNAEYKIAWIVPILLVPPIGAIFYLTLRRRKPPRRKLKSILEKTGLETLYVHDLSIMQRYKEKGDFAKQCAGFVAQQSFLPASDCKTMLEELRAAKKYIFLEYFVIAPGKCWDTIVGILKEKAQNGVDVRVIYDDIGSMLKVPSDYA